MNKILVLISLGFVAISVLNAMELQERFLIQATQEGNIAYIEELLRGGYVLPKTSYATTPLHAAVINGHYCIAQLFLSSGADVDAKTCNSSTSLHLAAANGCHELARLLLAYRADVDAENCYFGNTPLHIAASKGHHNVVQVLMAYHADVNKVTKIDGKTPLDCALRAQQNEVAYLLKHWDLFKANMHALWCKSILASHHSRCGDGSKLNVLPYQIIAHILSFLAIGDAIYSHKEIEGYVCTGLNS